MPKRESSEKINPTVSSGPVLSLPLFDRSTMRRAGSREYPAVLSGIPAGFRVVTFLMRVRPPAPSIPGAQGALDSAWADGHSADASVLCVAETGTTPADIQERPVLDLVERFSSASFSDLSRTLVRSFPAWRLFPLEIATSCRGGSNA